MGVQEESWNDVIAAQDLLGHIAGPTFAVDMKAANYKRAK